MILRGMKMFLKRYRAFPLWVRVILIAYQAMKRFEMVVSLLIISFLDMYPE